MQSSSNNNAISSNGAAISSYTGENEGFDFKYLVAKVAGNWQWFVPFAYFGCRVGSIIPLICHSYLTYHGKSSCKRKERQLNHALASPESQMLDELGLFSQMSDVNNEIQQIHSRTLIQQAIVICSLMSLIGHRATSGFQRSTTNHLS
jgi:hypothetical protein